MRYLRLQAGADSPARAAFQSRRQDRTVPERSGFGHAKPVELAAIRSVRQMDIESVAPPGPVRGRHRLSAGHGVALECTRTGNVHAKHRLRLARFSQHGRLGELRAGEPEPELAGVYRP